MKTDNQRIAISRQRNARDRRAEVEAFIAANGLRVEPFGSAGAVRVCGSGVDFLAASMRYLAVPDLRPLR